MPRRSVLFVMCLVAGSTIGCQTIQDAILQHPKSSEGRFDSPNPKARVNAITNAARSGEADEATLRALVETLESDDPLVRMMAITTLEQLTGHTMGYLHYDPPTRRRMAIARWKEYLDGDTLEAPGAADQSLPPDGEVKPP